MAKHARKQGVSMRQAHAATSFTVHLVAIGCLHLRKNMIEHGALVKHETMQGKMMTKKALRAGDIQVFTDSQRAANGIMNETKKKSV